MSVLSDGYAQQIQPKWTLNRIYLVWSHFMMDLLDSHLSGSHISTLKKKQGVKDVY